MSKKFTSLLVLATAMLLAVPTQAQVAKKAPKTQVKAFKTGKIDKKAAEKAKDAQLKAQKATVRGIAFRDGKSAVEAPVASTPEQAKAQKAADKKVGIAFAKWDWAAHQTPKFVPSSGLIDGLPKGEHRMSTLTKGLGVNKPALSVISRRVQGDPNAIITEVPTTAETKSYARSGSYHAYNSGVYTLAAQSGYTEIAFDGNDVYIKNPIKGYSSSTWIKGTKDGNTITVPLGQFLSYSASAGYGLYITLAQLTTSSSSGFTGTNLTTETEITYTIDGNTISLNGTDETKVLTVAWSDDNTVYQYGAPGGNYNTVYTLDEGYVPPTAQTDPIELPAGVTAEDWYADGTNSYPTGSSTPTAAKVAFDGNDVYVSGIFTALPDSWIKGTLDGNKVTFVTGQLLGQLTSGGTQYNVYSVGYEGGDILSNFTMTYDADAKTLTLDEGYNILANISVESLGYFQCIETLVISAEAPAPAQIDQLPYSNDFSTIDLKKHFSAIDANADGNTWGPEEDYFYISYASPNDDWLVSPAIKLVAGKKYHFAIDSWVRSASFPETFEVKAAAEATAEALAAGTVVLAEQTISNTANFTSTFPETYETYEFTVAETGYYYIGIHNTSNDMWNQYVDNFLIEGAPIVTPYTADFSTEAPIGDFFTIDNNEDTYSWQWDPAWGAFYSFSSEFNADDYLILPIKLDAGKTYDVTVTAKVASDRYPEKFSVVAGTEGTPEGLTTTVIAEQEITNTAAEDFTGSLIVETAGTYYVAIHVTSEADMYRLMVEKLIIEEKPAGNAPAAPTDFTVTKLDEELGATVALKAPATTIDGSALTDGAIDRIDLLRDGKVINTFTTPAPGAELNYVDNASDLTIGVHKYQAYAYGTEGAGGKTEEIVIFLSVALNPPYTFDFADGSVFDLFMVIDANNDDNTWEYYGTTAEYDYSSANAGDDYLVSVVPFNLVAGKTYNIIVNANANSAFFPERFEVKIGTEATVEGLSQTVIQPTDVTSAEPDDFEGQFSVAADGKYYIAVHAISDADMYSLLVHSITIEQGAEPTAPAAPAIEVAVGAEGDLSATVKVTAPTTSVDGNALTDNISIDVLRDDEVIGTKENVAPGTLVRILDEPASAGIYTYRAIPSNASGKGLKSEKVKVFVGTDALSDAQNFAIAGSTATTVDFTWEPAQGVNSGYVDAANVTYSLYTLAIETDPYWGFQYLVADQKLAEVTGETAATVNFPVDEGTLQYQYFGISVKDANTEESDPGAVYTYLIVGEPEALPIEEGFAGKLFHYAWNYTDNAGLFVTDDATDGDGVALNIFSYTSDSDQALWLEKINLKSAANPTLLFDVKSADISSVDIIGSVDGAEFSVIATQPVSSEYTTVKVPLASIVGTRFSKVGISAHFANATVVDPWYGTIEELGSVLAIDNVKVVDLYQYNLGVTVDAPASVIAGKKATVKATVENKGENAAEGYTIVIKAGDKELLNETATEALAPFKKSEITADFETSVFDEAGDVTITAEVVYTNDLDPDDNTADAIITIKEPTAQAPEGLTATDKGDAGVELAWSAPGSTDAAARAGAAEETENFDDESIFEPFSLGGITADQQTGAFGDWTLYDGNNMTVYGFSGITFPNAYAEAAWQVFNTTGDGEALAENGFGAHSGNQYLMSFCPVNESSTPAANHWLISPELPGIAQTISFYARAITGEYGAETFEVLASSTDNKPESFTIVGSAYSTTATEWTEYTAELPAGTKFFAIRHTSQDIFGLMVDDVTYLVGGAEVASYNIYYESELIASVTGDVTTYTVAGNKIQAGNRTFGVTAVYANGNESKPITAQVEVTTGIQKIATDGKPVDVYALDGKLVRQQTKSLDGLKGVYVINGKKVMIK